MRSLRSPAWPPQWLARDLLPLGFAHSSRNNKVRFVPAEPSQNEKAPDLRVLAGNNVEIGAAWKRLSKENTVYHSVKLDDPSFPAPIYANLVEVEGGHALVWSR